MTTDYAIFEIVLSMDGYWLIDPKTSWKKHTNRIKPLAAGYYVVSWPDFVKIRRFDKYAMYHGPFQRREEAEEALNSLYRARDWLTSALGLKAGAQVRCQPREGIRPAELWN